MISRSRARAAIGLDLGGSTLTGLLVDETGRVLARRRRATPRGQGPETVLEAMREEAAGLLAAAPPDLCVAGLGAGVAGPVDAVRGVCLFSPNLGWRDVEVAAYFRQAFDLPVLVDNDVRVATLGEGWVGAAKSYRTFITLTVGTGIGSGVVLDGRLWPGPGHSAGEIGHIPMKIGPGAPLCGCGRRGCLEALASGTAIRREARLVVERGEPTVLAEVRATTGDITARDVTEAARTGDAVARRIIEEAADHLGTGIATAVNLFNPEAVIVGGGVAGAWDLLSPVVERAVAERAFPPNLAFLRGVFPAALGEDAGAVGAASLVLAPLERPAAGDGGEVGRR
ncbi:MAG: ROK family protein [Bacillota bacterium]